jgi:hypothetical protein
MLSTAVYKVTIQETPIAEKPDWKVVATGTWALGQKPQLAEHALSTEVIEALFNVSLSGSDESSRNQVQFGDKLYAVVFRRLSK